MTVFANSTFISTYNSDKSSVFGAANDMDAISPSINCINQTPKKKPVTYKSYLNTFEPNTNSPTKTPGTKEIDSDPDRPLSAVNSTLVIEEIDNNGIK